MEAAKSRMPIARPSSEFVIEALPVEVLVYDQVNHRAHCLTPAAALVWKLCDGGPSQSARVALQQAGHSDSLEAVLAQLAGAGLLRKSAPVISRSRRAMLGKTAVAAGIVLASPVIYSIIAPSVAEAASVICGGTGQPCCMTSTPCNNAGLHCTNSTVPPPSGTCIP